MPGFLRPRSFHLWLAAAALLVVPLGLAAQGPEEVQFETADKVELHGSFFAPAKARAPCIILLHKYGGSRQQQGWKELTRELQKEFAVLTFDFRGHGESTNVDPERFWRTPNNQLIKNAGRFGSKISYHDFLPLYMPMLANDVSAAKRFLDRQNDAGVCNSSNVIIIGAEEGAGIGALWIACEFERPRLIKSPYGTWMADPQGRTEGDDVAGAVWLSIPKTLSGAYIGPWLKGRYGRLRDKVPMAFFYGDKDRKAADAAQVIFEDVKRGSRDKLEQTRLRPKDTKLAGNELLKESFNTITEIGAYADKVMQKHGSKAAVQRDVENVPAPSLLPLYLFFPSLR
jgi:hypothetical protein